jgi:hypothetical protein
MAFFLIDANKPFPSPPTAQPISAGVVYETTSKYVLPDAAVSGDVIPMIPVPARARVFEVTVGALAQAATVAVGDGVDPDRYITSGAVAAGAVARTNAATAFGYVYPAADTLDIVLGATPTDGGTVYLSARYVIE